MSSEHGQSRRSAGLRWRSDEELRRTLAAGRAPEGTTLHAVDDELRRRENRRLAEVRHVMLLTLPVLACLLALGYAWLRSAGGVDMNGWNTSAMANAAGAGSVVLLIVVAFLLTMPRRRKPDA